MAIELDGSHALARVAITATLGFTLGIAGCGMEQGDLSNEAPGEEEVQEATLAQSAALAEGERLFDEETFGGNGRTCLTCHTRRTGTLNPEQVQRVFDDNPLDPLFKHDGSNDFQGHGTSRILSDATILVRLRLPTNVELANDPARNIIVQRAIPTTLNTPALDPVLMFDGRVPNLRGQANGAIRGHAQATVLPTAEQLDLIVAYETTAKRFFSSPALREYAESGLPPELPQGSSPAQMRGRKWFVDTDKGTSLPADTTGDGMCALCHSGPMLNETNAALENLDVPFSVLAGARFQSVLVSELNTAQRALFTFVVHNTGVTDTVVESPDPGRALITNTWSTWAGMPDLGLRAEFKIPSLWGVKRTGPYFHDNSAATLEEVVEHHATFFQIMTPLVMTSQDKADLLAYLKLL